MKPTQPYLSDIRERRTTLFWSGNSVPLLTIVEADGCRSMPKATEHPTRVALQADLPSTTVVLAGRSRIFHSFLASACNYTFLGVRVPQHPLFFVVNVCVRLSPPDQHDCGCRTMGRNAYILMTNVQLPESFNGREESKSPFLFFTKWSKKHLFRARMRVRVRVKGEFTSGRRGQSKTTTCCLR